MTISWPRRPGSRRPFGTLLITLALATSRTSALSQQYCSTLNTGSDSSPVVNHYQSNGACSTSCQGYAFAVVQNQSCWCSNYAPGESTSTGSCNTNCPGYPFEQCGNDSAGLFGYVPLGPSPSGTQGGSSSSTSSSSTESDSSTQQPTSTPTPASSTATSLTPHPVAIVLDSSTSTTSTSSTTSTTSSTSSTSSTTSSTSTSSWTPTPVTSVMTVTGEIITKTITPTAPATQTYTVSKDTKSDGGFFSNTGKVAGTFVAVAIIIVLIGVALLWFCLRRRRKPEDASIIPSSVGDGTPQRRPSRLSQMGLLGRQGTAGTDGPMREKMNPSIQTSGWGVINSAERSPADTLDRRNSFPRVVDQRLEPTALWNPIHDNGSHVSVRSFRDDLDYSRRMLRIANPDS